MTKCFRTTVDLQQCNRRPAQPERNSQKSLHSFVVHSAGHPVSFTVYGRQDWTGLYAGKDDPLHQPSSSSPGPRVQVGPTSGQSNGHRSAALGPLRSTKTILGRTTWTRGPRKARSQPAETRCVGNSGSLGFTNLLDPQPLGAHSRTCP